MKAALYYYSGTGNTRLLCEYVAARITSMRVEPIDALEVRDGVDWKKYDAAGFACFTDFMGPSPFFRNRIREIPEQQDTPAFVLNTYGNMSGRTLPVLAKDLRKRGFNVAAGHSLHCPENFPPMIAGGVTGEDAPDEKEKKALDEFIILLNGILLQVQVGTAPKPAVLKLPFPDRIMYPMPRLMARMMMGRKFVDKERCTTCAVCKKGCPYGAIGMAPRPVFDEKKCGHCWRCYNRCPEKAIYTKKHKDRGMYPRPADALIRKLQP